MSLTIRNLTSIPLDLVLVDRFRPVQSSKNGSSGLFNNLTNFSRTSHPPRPSNPSLADHASSFSRLEVAIHIPAFAVRNTPLHAPSETDREPHPETIRLTFLAAGQKYRLDVPAPKFESQTLQSLAQIPKFRFTGFHVRDAYEHHVAVCDSAELNCWMKNLKDGTPLSALSIPGTHNSPTCYKALPSVRCQAVSPRAQLQNGVRFFDVRVQPEGGSSDRLILVHAVFPISLTGTKYLHDLLNDIYAFLEANPSESIIISLKREGTGASTDAQLARILHDSYTTKPPSGKHWYTKPKLPTLGAVRGKIVLLRRFRVDGDVASSSGINAESWADSTPYDLGKSICVQDFYQVLETVNIEKKVTYVTDQLRRSAQCVAHVPGVTPTAPPHTPQPLYLNFLSASNFWRVGCWPRQIARILNPAILRYLVVNHAVEEGNDHDRAHNVKRSVDLGGDGSTGIVVCDYVGWAGNWDLVRCIVAMNCKLMMREMESD